MNGSASLYGSIAPLVPPRRRRPGPGSAAASSACLAAGGWLRLVLAFAWPPPSPWTCRRRLGGRGRGCLLGGGALGGRDLGGRGLGRPLRGRLATGGARLRRRAVGLGGLLGVAHRSAAQRPAHRRALHEHPAHVGHGLAADQAALVEQPAVLAVELLERVVRQHDRVGPIRDLQQERVTAADHAGRRGEQLARTERIFERVALAVVDAVREARVDDDGDVSGLYSSRYARTASSSCEGSARCVPRLRGSIRRQRRA